MNNIIFGPYDILCEISCVIFCEKISENWKKIKKITGNGKINTSVLNVKTGDNIKWIFNIMNKNDSITYYFLNKVSSIHKKNITFEITYLNLLLFTFIYIYTEIKTLKNFKWFIILL